MRVRKALPFGSTFAGLVLGATAASANAACASARENPSLARAAIRYSRMMVARRFFGHLTPWGEDLRDRLLGSGYVSRDEPWHGGENLGWGTGALSTPAAMVTGWMDSPAHRAIVLSERWRRLGVGVVPGTPRRSRIAGATYTLLLGSVDRGPSGRATKRVMVGRKVRPGA